MSHTKLTAAIAVAFTTSAASAMAPMADDGARDATWTGSPVTAQGPQTRDTWRAGSVTIIDVPVQNPAIISDRTPVHALGRGMARSVPDERVEVVERQIITVTPVEQDTWARGSPSGSQQQDAQDFQGDASGQPQAVGPQGWQGDRGDAMHGDDQQSLADDVGPQGWERSDRLASEEGSRQPQSFDRSEMQYGSPNDQPPGASPRINFSNLE